MSTTKIENVIVTESSDAAGAVVWWSLNGEVSIETAEKAWENSGLSKDLFIPAVVETMALRRAMARMEEKNRLVRPLKLRGHYAVVAEEAGDESIQHTQEARVFLAGEPELKVVVIPENHKLQEEIQSTYDHFLTTFTADDVSWWLVQLTREVKAVSLRSRGGFYFIPRDYLEQWRRMVEAITSISNHQVFELPAMPTKEAVNAILVSVTKEAEEEAKEMEDELMDEKLGPRALRNRVSRCGEMTSKVEHYEQLLGENLQALRERLSSLHALLAAAALTASANEDATS